jgi:hypothetical protein
MKADVNSATIHAPGDRLSRLRHAGADIAATGRIADLQFIERDGPLDVSVSLA